MIVESTLFAPVQSTTAFEETLERLGTAIKLGLLEPGTRLPAERELCEQLGIARSTLRQALTALVQSGHLHAVRGRGGGTFVAETPPSVGPPSPELLAQWREACDTRLAVELGVAVLAAERAEPETIERLDELVGDDGPQPRRLRRLPAAPTCTSTSASPRRPARPGLVAATTEAQGAMTDLISHIAHPPEVLAWSNAQHARLVDCLRRRDQALALRIMAEHLRGTEHVLAGLLP